MVSKTQKFRGSRTHGRGHKRGRGAGMRGGRGNAGLHKHKWSYTLKYMPDHFGRHGFKRPQSVVGVKTTINVGEIEERLPQMVKEGAATGGKDSATVDLEALGIEKLLGGGNVGIKLTIKVPQASANAVEKVQEAGGSVTQTQPKVEKPAKKADAKGAGKGK